METSSFIVFLYFSLAAAPLPSPEVELMETDQRDRRSANNSLTASFTGSGINGNATLDLERASVRATASFTGSGINGNNKLA